MIKRTSEPLLQFAAFIISLFLITSTFYLQSYANLTPCPLCYLQRFAWIALGILFFFGSLFAFKKSIALIIYYLELLFCSIGLLFSGRQSWLQFFPAPEDGNCSINIFLMLKMLPFGEVLKKVWQGGTECAQMTWAFLHLSLAEWSFVMFSLFFIFIIYRVVYLTKKI